MARQKQLWWLTVMQQAVVDQHGHGRHGHDASTLLEEQRRSLEKTADRLGDESISPSPSQTSPASGFGALQANCEAFPADATLQVEVAELRKKITALEADRFEPPELEELQALCSTLESQRRGLEQEVQRLHGSSAELEARLASSANVQEKLQSLVEESSVLEEDLALERANHARLAAEAEGERAKTEELRRRLSELEDENAALLKMVGSQQESTGPEEDLAVERANHARLMAEAEEEKANKEELRRRLSELEDENAALLKMMGSQQAAAQKAKCAPEEAAKTLELERKLSELEDENSALLKMMGSQQAAVRQVAVLTAQIDELKSQNQQQFEAASDGLAEQLAARAILEAEDELRDKVPADPTDEAFELQALQALVKRLQTERDYLVQKDRSQQAELEELRRQASAKLPDEMMESEWKSRYERLEERMKAADADIANLRQQVVKSGELSFESHSRDKNVEEQVPDLRSSEEAGQYQPGGQPCKDKSLAEPPELSGALAAIDSPGVYVVSQTVALTVGPEKSSAKLQNLSVGTVVQVLEVVHQQEDKRVRGRVEDPAGWISIVGTEDSNRWASRDLQRSNRSASLRSEQLLSLQRELDALETAMEEQKSAARKDAQNCKEEEDNFRAAAAEDLSRCEQQLREKSERCRNLELELKQVSLQLDGPGVYLLASDVDVSESSGRSSQKLGRLLAGEEVHVLEVVHRKAEKRVRGRVAAKYSGWISLMDTAEGYRWAHRQLSATNEWISGLLEKSTPLACETELRARCAALEAHRDSILLELEQLQTVGEMSSSRQHGGPGHTTGMENSASELQELRANVMVLEAGRDELELQAELLRTKYQTLEAEYEELQQYSAALSSDSAAARGRALQAEELRRQVERHVKERGVLEAELARLRAEVRALVAEVQDLRTAPLGSPLAMAEKWVLYAEVPALETSSITYMGKIVIDFEEELKGPLGPLATVNCNRSASATSAFHRGDASRVALNAYCKADPESRGYLEQHGVHTFLEAVFQQHGLTPPLKAHVDAVYHRFGPEEDRLEALACLCLADAMLRTVLRMHAEQASVSRTVPSTQDVAHRNAGTAPLPYPQAASTCPSCGEPCEGDQKFCMACGTRLPTAFASQVADRSTTDGPRRAPALSAALPARQLHSPPVVVGGGGAVTGGTMLDPSRIKRVVVGNSAGMSASSVPNVCSPSVTSKGNERVVLTTSS